MKPEDATQTPAGIRARADAAIAHLPGLILSAERLAAVVSPGAHGLRRAGLGEDFWQYRPASAGDGARSIDWRRSARSDAQFVRDREAQTAQAMAIWVSAGRGMYFSGGADRPEKAARAQLLALALAMLLLRGGEKVAMLGRPPRTGRTQSEALAEALSLTRPIPQDSDQPAISALRPGQRIALIADFLDDPDWLPPFLARASQLGITGVLMQVLDPAEEEFPYSGAVVFRSAAGASSHDSRDAEGLRAAYLARLAARRDWLGRQASGAGWLFGHHSTGQPPAVALEWLHRVLGG